jgi:hypothetical protein
MNRPAGVVAVLVVVLLHALLLVGRAVASALSLASFALTHPGFRWTPALLISTASGTLVSLVLAVGDVLLVGWLWRGARRARVVLTALVVVSGLLVLGGVVTLLSATSGVSAVPVALSTVQLLLCGAAAVLLWLPSTGAWLRSVSVRPAGPGL